MLIYLMNVVDWVCTLSLLRTGRFYEANPLMQSYIGSPTFGFVIKVLFPAAAQNSDGSAEGEAAAFISLVIRPAMTPRMIPASYCL